MNIQSYKTFGIGVSSCKFRENFVLISLCYFNLSLYFEINDYKNKC